MHFSSRPFYPPLPAFPHSTVDCCPRPKPYIPSPSSPQLYHPQQQKQEALEEARLAERNANNSTNKKLPTQPPASSAVEIELVSIDSSGNLFSLSQDLSQDSRLHIEEVSIRSFPLLSRPSVVLFIHVRSAITASRPPPRRHPSCR